MPEVFQLTDENYYSREADINYMSCSQYQAFQKCEAAEIAKLRGLWEPEKQSDALFQGQYFHSYFESPEAFKKFCEDGSDKIFKTKTTKARGTEIIGKYAPFELLDQMILAVHQDPLMSMVLSWPGENEMPMVGTVGGIPWRMKMDKYCASGRKIIDYKTSANLRETFYNPVTKEHQTFVEEYGYLMRAAVYGEIERQNAKADTFPTFIILGVSKQSPPDKEAFLLNDDARWELELKTVKANVPHIQRLKNGEENPRRCGECEYCRRTKQLRRFKMYTDLMPQFRFDPDNQEYDDYAGTSIFDTL
ncbi:MAG: PD-(D/E)XK nuclease-like domain-containing protein [Clostridiales bacterium]|jgi:hypothetical protein|nr:PD-(D/E)XK nuclease-like domain-containing protein [Clostridiales bacterium]MCI1961126.1 PD-(D/E)XK nuclease-like domain-containing protein [Clostridiales bacterium]MCI2021567.1 PD-(D/E)XK nuclease-like domain-containing protein [Clostridiales bacterium]MCI2026353.1 PD-(D/E)XK nuclease-like domain-containing protein [Clostridiales bacterium]